MKKILAIIAAMSLVFSMSACGKKNNDDAGSSVTQGGVAVDADGNKIPGSTIDGAGKEVDMDKIEGEPLEIDENVDKKSKGDIGSYYVSIDEAKTMVAGDSKILVVSFTFENKSNQPAAFSNVFSVDFTQNETKMTGVPINVDGVNVNSAVELIDPGKSTKVQRVRYISDEETPVQVSVYKYGEPAGDCVKKIFKLQ